MDDRKTNKGTGGVGFLGLLTLLFIALKLLGKINWNWIWVLSPIWIGWTIIIILVAIVIFIKR